MLMKSAGWCLPWLSVVWSGPHVVAGRTALNPPTVRVEQEPRLPEHLTRRRAAEAESSLPRAILSRTCPSAGSSVTARRISSLDARFQRGVAVDRRRYGNARGWWFEPEAPGGAIAPGPTGGSAVKLLDHHKNGLRYSGRRCRPRGSRRGPFLEIRAQEYEGALLGVPYTGTASPASPVDGSGPAAGRHVGGRGRGREAEA